MEIILIVYLIVSIALIGIILLQQGKGAEMGASFGAGGANTVFGAAGSGNALTKATTILTILFFAIALSISYLNSEPAEIKDSILDEVPASQTESAKGIESQLPTEPKAGIESQVAPTEAAKSDEQAAAKQAVEAKIEEAKAKLDTTSDEVKSATEKAQKKVDETESKKDQDSNK
ncbi:preprotein translocase subunit SecG [Aliikangiella maris]|uniref:Preprotein translocase subunit SecG n=2 Tax=Aliikangiella maris TaxID=3162458 RepID=A0ABV3MS95_9GAMM